MAVTIQLPVLTRYWGTQSAWPIRRPERQRFFSNTTGNFNTGTGFGALSANMTGSGNTAIGRNALPLGH